MIYTKEEMALIIKCCAGSSTKDDYTFTEYGINMAAELLLNPSEDHLDYAKDKENSRKILTGQLPGFTLRFKSFKASDVYFKCLVSGKYEYARRIEEKYAIKKTTE
jgi:hypothetical protein